MNRVLALQGMAVGSIGGLAWDSNQSVGCSSSTAKCSTTSSGCGGTTVPFAAW